MKWIARMIVAITLSVCLWVFVTAARTERVRVIEPQEIPVMEFLLRQKGYKERVESGTLEQRGQEVWAILSCRSENGQIFFTRAILLGRLDRREMLEEMK